MTTEFPRPIRLDKIGTAVQSVTITATDEECAALVRRFDLVSLGQLVATLSYHMAAKGIVAKGQLRATLAQSCVVTGDPVPATIEEDFDIRFIPPHGDNTLEEIELAEGDCDVIEHDGQSIDLGEAVAQTLALALDPYPRSAGAAERLRAAGVISEDEAGPFGALAALRDTLAKG
jgi:uncharacterized metal-binding protein YceD (DUF177 family)